MTKDPISPAAAELNRTLERESPAIARSLSALGRRAVFPRDIPFQAGEARGKEINATIGQITDGAGRALPLPAIVDGLAALDPARQNQAMLYAPVPGLPELRRAWHDRQRRLADAEAPATLPVTTVGLSHGLSLVADLFGGPGRPVLVPSPFWGNYRQAFATRTEAELVPVPTWVDGRFDAGGPARALAGLDKGVPAVVLLNFPSNPGGFSPEASDRFALVEALVEAAEDRDLIVLCDDAYAGLTYKEIPSASLFWRLAGAHPRLLAVKVDGVTKELAFFGGRVGFLTFGLEPSSPSAAALESKVAGLIRATLGSPVAVAQALVAQALLEDRLELQIAEVRAELADRYRTLKRALDNVDSRWLRPLPFNSGCFALVEVPAGLGLDAETVRRHLLDHHDAGVISIAPRYLRIAFCSVRCEHLPILVDRIEAAVRELARGALGPSPHRQ